MCDMKFVMKTQLENHMRSHTKEQPYQCNQCDRKFSQRGSWKRHMQLHTGLSLFKFHSFDLYTGKVILK